MKNINLQFVREFGEYIEFNDSIGYIYKVGNEFFSFNKEGFKKIN